MLFCWPQIQAQSHQPNKILRSAAFTPHSNKSSGDHHPERDLFAFPLTACSEEDNEEKESEEQEQTEEEDKMMRAPLISSAASSTSMSMSMSMSMSTSVDTDLLEADLDAGALTPAVSNCYSKRSVSMQVSFVPPSPLSSAASRAVEEEQEQEQEQHEHELEQDKDADDSTLGDSWEAIEPDMDDLEEEEEDEEDEEDDEIIPPKTPAPGCGMPTTATTTTAASAFDANPVIYNPPPMVYKAPPIVYRAPPPAPAPAPVEPQPKPSPEVYKPRKTKKSSIFFLLMFCAALLFGVLAAAGVLDYILEKQAPKMTTNDARSEPVKKSEDSSEMSTVETADATTNSAMNIVSRPGPMYHTNTTTIGMTAPQEVMAEPQHKNQDESNDRKFLWLSLDDDVLAGQVFWGNETTTAETKATIDKHRNMIEVREDRLSCSRPFQLDHVDDDGQACEVDINLNDDELELGHEHEHDHDWNDEIKNDENMTILTYINTSLPTPTYDHEYWIDKLEHIQSLVDLYENGEQPTTTLPQQQHHGRHPRRQKMMHNGPINWVARHYQRLNVYVLGQSQLAQLKRRQNLIW